MTVGKLTRKKVTVGKLTRKNIPPHVAWRRPAAAQPQVKKKSTPPAPLHRPETQRSRSLITAPDTERGDGAPCAR
ncbi:unnamed protein product [Ectocarpus sp. CCAP 1310/34]|nr:unnamed protein product [Ectocarpus sp. CCAP 1310/34]